MATPRISQSNRIQIVTTTSARISEQPFANTERLQLLIRNNSPTTVTIALGDVPAESLRGIVLTQNQTYTESSTESFPCWNGNIQAIASANSNVTIVERFRS